MKTFKKGFKLTRFAFSGWIFAFGMSAVLGASGLHYFIGQICVGVLIIFITFLVGIKR